MILKICETKVGSSAKEMVDSSVQAVDIDLPWFPMM